MNIFIKTKKEYIKDLDNIYKEKYNKIKIWLKYKKIYPYDNQDFIDELNEEK